ncbi:sulfatase-like hydrolase/transferase [Prosthecobacter dejongeii]|uniref:sulfatase-like hydrolase/transferase n=1 Tax=Prosthecobacter dejongeii TaxID=48465 RepID=UPI00160C1688
MGFLLWLLIVSTVSAQAKPNILLILADDCTYNDLPVYGGVNAKTPNIDSLASQGLTFNRAYVSEAICQPCRAELYTGQYPMRNGCAWNHSASRPGTRSLPHHLAPLGYRIGLAGKSHVLPEASFPFESVPGFDPSCVRNPTQAHDLAGAREFMGRKQDEPFCLVIALVDPHVPWVMGDATKYPPKKIQLPPNIADTPKTRDDFSRYLAEITYMDGQVGEILSLLKESGQEQNTLVLFSSEQGSQFPGNKWTNWDTGLHTALIARWPGQILPGQRTDALVQYADVAPTLVDLAGGKGSENAFDGQSFAAVLRGEKKDHRAFAYGLHNNIPEGPAYPIRTVTDGEYRYIRNLTPNDLYVEKHIMGIQGNGALNNAYWPTWVNFASDNPAIYALVKRYVLRPAEEVYHTASDPFERINLADDPPHRAIRTRLAGELDRWLLEQGDPGIPQDTKEAHQAAKRGEHLFPKP